MQTTECGKCGTLKRSAINRCASCDLGIFKPHFYWMLIVAICGFLLFSFSRVESPNDHDETTDRKAIDTCRSDAMRGPQISQIALSPCAMLIEDFIQNYGHHPD
jgi:hypothetical protein